MRSTYHHLAQARVALLTLTDAPHAALCRSHATALDELRAASQETEKLARVHPATVTKEAAVGGFSALSLLAVLVFGRSFSQAYLEMRRQLGAIEIPFIDIGSQIERLLPAPQVLEQASRLPEITWEQAVYGAIAVAVAILLFHAAKALILLRRERLLSHAARELAEASHVLRAAADAASREQALLLLAQGMDTSDDRKPPRH